MVVALLPPFCQPSPRHAFWLCMVVLLIWSTSLVSAQEEYRRVYKVKDIGDKPLKDMADAVKRCDDWVGGKLPILDTIGKQIEIEYAVDMYRAENNITREVWTMLGGSVSGKTCNLNTAQLPGHCFWCWDYGTGNCGANNESMIGTGLSPNYKPYGDHFNNWEPGHPYLGDERPYMYYYYSVRRFWPETASKATDLLCVVKEPITDSTESSSSLLNVSLEEPAAAPSGFTKWWVVLVIILGLLVFAAIVIAIVFCCCCGAGAPVEEEYKSEDDDRLSSVRDTRSNRSLVSRGGSMRSMGSSRSSDYSASQLFHQDDMEDYNSYSDDRASQGRSADSYYY